jgi:hypothetical protein
MVIRILDYVKTSSTYRDGETIFDLIYPRLREGEEVTVSFDGIRSLPSAFINAAFVRLLEFLPIDVIKQRLKISHSTRQINALVKQRFAFAEQAGLNAMRTPRDTDRIDINEDVDVRYWSHELGVDEAKIREIVKRVGPSAAKVRQALRGR